MLGILEGLQGLLLGVVIGFIFSQARDIAKYGLEVKMKSSAKVNNALLALPEITENLIKQKYIIKKGDDYIVKSNHELISATENMVMSKILDIGDEHKDAIAKLKEALISLGNEESNN